MWWPNTSSHPSHNKEENQLAINAEKALFSSILATGLRCQYHSIWIYNRVLHTKCYLLVFHGQKQIKRDTKTLTEARLNKLSLSYSAALNLTKMSKYTELREPHT